MSKVKISTGKGDMIVELYDNETPITTDNFKKLINEGFYNGLNFHRVLPDFVIQGGCPNGTGAGGPGYNIDGEFKSNGFDNPHSHVKGSIAWARSMARNSAGSQFYITLGDTSFLDEDYACFGKIISGEEVLGKLNELGSNSGAPQDMVVIESVTINTNGIEVPEVKKV